MRRIFGADPFLLFYIISRESSVLLSGRRANSLRRRWMCLMRFSLLTKAARGQSPLASSATGSSHAAGAFPSHPSPPPSFPQRGVLKTYTLQSPLAPWMNYPLPPSFSQPVETAIETLFLYKTAPSPRAV